MKLLFGILLLLATFGCGAPSADVNADSDSIPSDRCTICGCWGEMDYVNQCTGDLEADCSDDMSDPRPFCNPS
jgi:hypothetical protein